MKSKWAGPKNVLIQKVTTLQTGVVYTPFGPKWAKNKISGYSIMKFRQYSIVIHNVCPEKTQAIVEKYVENAQEFAMSVEPYPQGNGSHLHLFVQYKNRRSFKSVLKELELLKNKFIVPRPQDEVRDWGRVQLDVMKGRFSQAEAYLQGETKDKPTGEVLTGRVKPCYRRFRWKKLRDVGTKIERGKLEEFCQLCSSSACRGCCQGCMCCDPTHPEYEEALEKMREKKNSQDRKKYLV